MKIHHILKNHKYFCHGGTTVINSITERKGAVTALLTTKGFRDVLEIGRGNRPDLYNLHTKSPTPFVPRYLRYEIDERIIFLFDSFFRIFKSDRLYFNVLKL